MSKYTKEDIIRLIEEEDVEFIRLQFTDIFGTLKNVAITAGQIGNVIDNGCMFDGSSIEGFARIEESDMYLYPDLDTFEIFPWRPQTGKVARLICNVYKPDGSEFDGDPRFILKKVVKEAADMGYTVQVGPELEFFLFHTDDYGMPTTITHEKGGYFDLGPVDLGENARRDMVLTLEDMGFEIETSHHEVAPAQHEIDFKYAPALQTADNIVTFKLVVKSIAKRHGLYASFMPKPIYGVPGSGMHLNFSIMDQNGKNIFGDENDKYGISKEAYYFIAGMLEHAKGMMALTNPLVNSYKRLVPDYEAPIHIAWSAVNRSPLIRVPAVHGGSYRIELRSPDSAGNPYLVLACCIAAGLEGMREKKMPMPCVEKNVFAMSREEQEAAGIESLPITLQDAIRELEKDELVKKVLGPHTSEKYIQAKYDEWERYRTQITNWEIDEYLYKI